MYSKQVAEHIASPRNVGELDSPSGVGDVTNEVCKDRIRLTVRTDGEVVSQAKVKARGCPPTIAAASALTELIMDRPISELRMLSRADIVDALGHLPPAKKHCAALALEALREALDDIGRRAPRPE
ncbi:MAG TPA: iron-sulfur cluster assembly scaffold protein [Blastocatellia bacterium]|nr:iron-sulfur cluster assembly scaffold protein [Blastocatellia bacterium]